MKAPFSKKARLIFNSREAMIALNERRARGESIDRLKVKDTNGKLHEIRTSERFVPDLTESRN